MEEADKPPTPLEEREGGEGGSHTSFNTGKNERVVEEADKPPTPLGEGEGGEGGSHTSFNTGRRGGWWKKQINLLYHWEEERLVEEAVIPL